MIPHCELLPDACQARCEARALSAGKYYHFAYLPRLMLNYVRADIPGIVPTSLPALTL